MITGSTTTAVTGGTAGGSPGTTGPTRGARTAAVPTTRAGGAPGPRSTGSGRRPAPPARSGGSGPVVRPVEGGVVRPGRRVQFSPRHQPAPASPLTSQVRVRRGGRQRSIGRNEGSRGRQNQ